MSRSDKEEMCFYRPLPPRSITRRDFFRFCLSAVSVREAVCAALFLILSAMLGLLVPKISYYMFSAAVPAGDIQLVRSTAVFAIGIVVSAVLLMMLYYIAAARIGTRLKLTAESAAMERVLGLPQSFFDKYSEASISMRINYLKAFCENITGAVIMTGFSAAFGLAYYSQIAVFTPAMALPVLGVMICAAGFIAVSAVRLSEICRKRMLLEIRSQESSLDYINGIQKIRLAGAQERIFSGFSAAFSAAARVIYDPPVYIKLRIPILLFITLAGQLIIYMIGLKTGTAQAAFYASQSAYGMVGGCVAMLAQAAVSAAQAFAALEMAVPILKTAPEAAEDLREVTSLKGEVDLHDVSFGYGEDIEPVIAGLSLSVRPGEYVAVVGRSGCGKSTLIRLLLGLEKPQSGTVSYDGNDLELLDKSSLRRHIGTVMQNEKLCNDSIYANISLCAPALTMDEAWRAAELAGIADDIRELPMGMQTVISEENGGFSEGQKQRLVIARTIASDPDILIFDEAMSALDNRTQRTVSDALVSMNCTRIVAAHRLSAVRHCDRILVMDRGRIAEEGTYEELMAGKGLFAELVRRQCIDGEV